ncbi:MAG TPA: phosphoadenylyl-sulfate reductase [Solirubrobacterales bacterium]|nr:phosphoadenylyl-sulfate reductase [Solirubrobacterales bacterium]
MKPPPVTLSGTVPTPADLDHEAIAAELERSSAQEALEWMFENFGEGHYIACSFQKTSSVTAHLATTVNPEARFFYLDTEVLFEESYETRDRLAEALGIEFDRFHNLTLEEQEAEHGPELWNRDPDACCALRKVEPMRRALSSVDCWVAGVRRADSSTRSKTPKFAWDKRFNLWKLNPLADWTERDVWNYIREHHLPYNPLHDRGYPSIGCTHCTKPVEPGGDLRDGRWSGLAKTECGIN